MQTLRAAEVDLVPVDCRVQSRACLWPEIDEWIMSTLNIAPDTYQRLLGRAAELGYSADELVARLLECEQNYRLAVDNLADVVARHSFDGRILYVADSVRPVLGYIPAELVGRSVYDLLHPDDATRLRATLLRLVDSAADVTTELTVEGRVRGKDGVYLWLEATYQVNDDAGCGEPRNLVVVARPIAQRKAVEEDLRQREAALRASESRFRSLLESASGAIIVLGQDSRIVLVNRRAEEMFGYTRAEMLGQGLELLIPARFHQVHADHHTRFVAHPRLRPMGQGMDLVARHKDGREFPVEVGLSYAPAEDGILVMSYVTDITARRQIEANRLEQERLRASLRKEREYNTLLQRTISALSHDIRTPLTVIATAKDMLEQYFDRMSEQKRHEKLDSIGRQLHYVLELLNDMTLVVQGSLEQGVFRPEPVNLAALCRISLDEIRASTGTRHPLHFVSDGTVETAHVDQTLVSRILLNLLSNAVKFTPATGEVRLELGRRDDWIVLRVIDQGIGIDPAAAAHIFEPFYRAANVQGIGGTGLGLHIVHECVARHRGRIWVESEPGHGATFTVELPYTPYTAA